MRRLSDLTVAVACELFNEAAAAGTGKSDIDFINARMPYSNEKLPVRARVTDRESTRNKLKTKGNWMRRTTGVFSLVSIAVLLGALGCSTLHKSDSVTLQGTWQGREIGGKTEGPCYLAVSGDQRGNTVARTPTSGTREPSPFGKTRIRGRLSSCPPPVPMLRVLGKQFTPYTGSRLARSNLRQMSLAVPMCHRLSMRLAPVSLSSRKSRKDCLPNL